MMYAPDLWGQNDLVKLFSPVKKFANTHKTENNTFLVVIFIP